MFEQPGACASSGHARQHESLGLPAMANFALGSASED